MLQPVRTKYRKAFKGRIHETQQELLNKLWSIGLKAVQPERIMENKLKLPGLLYKIYEEQVKFGQEYFQISQFQKNQRK